MECWMSRGRDGRDRRDEREVAVGKMDELDGEIRDAYCPAMLFFRRAALLAALIDGGLVLVACSSPGAPSTSVAGARPTSPSNGASLSYYNQPIAIVVSSAVATGGAQVAATVEVAADSAFGNIVQSQAPSPDATGQLVVMLEHLQPATTYYWRVKTTAGNNPGTVSPTTTFAVGPLLTLQPPTPVQPLADTFPHKRPTFVIADSARNISAAVSYHVDVALDAAFAAIVANGTAAEAPTQTLFTLPADLVPGKTYYWRAQASDTTKGVTSAYSPAQVFSITSPDDGSYAYTVQVQWPGDCPAKAAITGGGLNFSPGVPNQFGWANTPEFSFDGTLLVAGDSLQLSLPTMAPIGGPFKLTLQRAGNHVAGTVLGAAPGSGAFTLEPFRISAVFFDGNMSGSGGDQGRFNGTFDGSLGLWKAGFPGDATVTCATSGFTWTLTPR
jgi:hypothetical protein